MRAGSWHAPASYAAELILLSKTYYDKPQIYRARPLAGSVPTDIQRTQARIGIGTSMIPHGRFCSPLAEHLNSSPESKLHAA